MADTPITLTQLNQATAADAAEWLRPCCASRRWLDEIIRLRPYGNRSELRAHSDTVLAALPWEDVREAIDAHPRIGERAGGADTESAWSRAEQSSAATQDQQTQADLVDRNRRYEERFGHVFLICATGLSAKDILDALDQRLANSPEDERVVVRDELTRIVALRIDKLVIT
ncbi:2-oxo-4-hydroxy-4-carboxy-5-ureidoimidazoline decarboxylase [Labedaea rhizosphaerae]|uniref:2-oxo-4-hydroxy-4-carboxy-5-ureidoimidazoline decarboxylase n=1 Tax=Labedaea rhizosphaerae TaxID=598644 RepID=A0A4R6SGB4_LABRH|nr:2-oxo-4-hydroxy-4-carboxy-5-ureidoimidazoline decarboxylase [Labedaea rhizosphaerae]TDQ01062.1 2-oxo-4-hydroxy-4-carboxy-5-ureidoimidazoline decarboxylase [Labedaea rhizosphaerae]